MAGSAVESAYPNPRRSVMASQKETKLGWAERLRERKRLKRDRTGDSPEKLAERHTPAETAADRMVRLGGVERESRFKGD